MTPRSIRRAAERKAKKQAAKSLHLVAPQVPAAVPAAPEEACSPARLQANRLNAQLSTGPRTLDGKSTSCLNAVKTALTGRTVLLPADDAVAYRRHLQNYQHEFQPVGLRERELVQSLADTQWRLRRIPGLEMAIYSQGRVEFEGAFDHHRPDLRSNMIELHTFIKYEKQLRNLHVQESRLQRRYEKESAELRTLQTERKQAKSAEPAFSPTSPQAGFEFSNASIEQAFSLPENGFEFSNHVVDPAGAPPETSKTTLGAPISAS